MRKILLAGGLMAIMLLASIMVVGDKTISNDSFTTVDGGSLVNATAKTVDLKVGKLYNNSANLFVYNNATYDWVKMKIAAGENQGKYPSDLRVDLNNDGRYEYAFTGSGVGEMGNQSWIYSPQKTLGKTAILYPSPTGDTVMVKVPSRATVKSVELNITHPVEAVYNTVTLTSTTPGLAYDIGYYYYYDYSYYGSAYSYGYCYYYMNMPQYYALSSPSSYYYIPQGSTNYLGLNYKPASYYDWYKVGYSYNYYVKWDHTNPNVQVPPGAQLLEYNLVWPIRDYSYYSPYGYSWTSGKSSYYSGEKTYGVWDVTGAWPTTYMYKYEYTNPTRWYAYNYGNIQPHSSSGRDSLMATYLPTVSATPFATHTKPETFYTTSYNDYSGMSFNIYSKAREWMDGTKTNNGVMVNVYKTPYSTYPHNGDNYCMYNTAYNYGAAWDRNHGYYYTPGQFGNPYYTYNSNYEWLKPKLVVGFTLPSQSPWIDVGSDGVKDYTYPGELKGGINIGGYQNAMNNYLRTHFPDSVDEYGNEWTYVPIKVGAGMAGKIVMKDLKVLYDYEPEVYYNMNAGTGTLTGEVNKAVPNSDSGWTLLPMNVTSSTPGTVTFKDLEMTGMKPNYAPALISKIPDMNVDEGIVNDKVIVLSDYITDTEQAPSSLIFIVQKNDKPNRIELSIVKGSDGKVYLSADASKDPNWFGNVSVVVSATDSGGKEVWTNEFKLNVQPVNDYPYSIKTLPSIDAEEGVDDMQVDYQAPVGRDVAKGKWSMMMKGDGSDYFADVEGEEILLDFQLLDADMNPLTADMADENGFRIYKGLGNEVTLTVLPPEYTDDPDNYVIMIGSKSDYSSADGNKYYMAVYASDQPLMPTDQTRILIPVNIEPVNDEPMIEVLPEIVIDEDQAYMSKDEFIQTYVTDVDTPLSQLRVTVTSDVPEIEFKMVDGKLSITPEENYNGIAYATVVVSDGMSESAATFRVVVKSINDIPTLIVENVFDGMLVDDILVIRGTAEDVEKNLKSVQIAIVEEGGFVSSSDWVEVSGSYIWNYMFDIRSYEEGEYEVHVRAYDGNRDFSEEYLAKVLVKNPKQKVELTPPTVTLSTDLSGTLSDSKTVEGTVNDESGYIQFVEFRVDSGNWKKATVTDMEAWKCVVNTRMLENEQHTFFVRSYDGKAYSAEVSADFLVSNEDSDLDGVTNEDERIYSMDPFNAIDGTMDYDNDGYSNAVEIAKGTDIFDATSHPKDINADASRIDTWAIVMIVVAVIFAIVIIGLFLMNLRMDRSMHKFREELNTRRAVKKPKTLLQKIVEIAPNYKPNVVPLSGPTLGSGQVHQDHLPPGPENLNQ
jgi:hypothetical protein